jgi:uncharacterized protein (TIGR00251 family)
MSWYELRGADLVLRVRVQPKASREGIEGVRAARLRVRVAPPPAGGAANARTIALIAAALAIPRSRVAIVRGERSREKEIVVINGGRDSVQLLARLEIPAG